MEAGYELIEDQDFEAAKKNGHVVKVFQKDTDNIYPPGKVTAYSEVYVAIDGKRLHRISNRFKIID